MIQHFRVLGRELRNPKRCGVLLHYLQSRSGLETRGHPGARPCHFLAHRAEDCPIFSLASTSQVSMASFTEPGIATESVRFPFPFSR
jgi:hypothetical protein